MFSVQPEAKCLVMAFGRRKNDAGQPCDVIIGAATYNIPKEPNHESNIDIIDHRHKTTQLRLVARTAKPLKEPVFPYYMLLHQRDVPRLRREEEEEEDKDEELDFHHLSKEDIERLKKAEPVMESFDRMVRGYMMDFLGRRIPVLQWLRHVTQETRKTPAKYFAVLADFYLRTYFRSTTDFCKNHMNYAEIVQFICGHHVWTYPYCGDECITSDKHHMQSCDVWGTSRWIPTMCRATDCEDNTADILATFYALCDADPDQIAKTAVDSSTAMYTKLLRKVQEVARQYTALAVDTVLCDKQGYALHLYVKLIPTNQLARLVRGLPPSKRDDALHILTLDSTRRTWSPIRSMSTAQEAVQRVLYKGLRTTAHPPCDEDTIGNCEMCRLKHASQCFSWGTPLEMWQRMSKTVYHTDLRFYDPRGGRVYMPVLGTTNNANVFGIPALYLNGTQWIDGKVQRSLTHRDAYPLPGTDALATVAVTLKDITCCYTEQGPFAKEIRHREEEEPPITSSKVSECKEEEEEPILLPPVPPISFNLGETHAAFECDPDSNLLLHPIDNLSSTIPVYIRVPDAAYCASMPPNQANTRKVQQHMLEVAKWLVNRCRNQPEGPALLKVVRAERLYVHDPTHYVYVLYVTATDALLKIRKEF
jgi:hypothetical protein